MNGIFGHLLLNVCSCGDASFVGVQGLALPGPTGWGRLHVQNLRHRNSWHLEICETDDASVGLNHHPYHEDHRLCHLGFGTVVNVFYVCVATVRCWPSQTSSHEGLI